jgi:hypothetical protein
MSKRDDSGPVCSDNKNTDDSEKEDSYSDWEEIIGDNGSQPQKYQELQGPKYTLPTTVAPVTSVGLPQQHS